MDFGLSIGSEILFITKHINHHNFCPNLNIGNLSVLESPGHPRDAQKDKKHCRIKWIKYMYSTISEMFVCGLLHDMTHIETILLYTAL